MIIDLGRRIFVVHPDKRFSSQNHVPEGTLLDLHHRYKKLEYSIGDLKEFLYIRTRKDIDRKTLWLWMQSIDIYTRAQMARKVRAKYVTPEFFGEKNKQTIIRIFSKAQEPIVTLEDENSINDVYRRIEEYEEPIDSIIITN